MNPGSFPELWTEHVVCLIQTWPWKVPSTEFKKKKTWIKNRRDISTYPSAGIMFGEVWLLGSEFSWKQIQGVFNCSVQWKGSNRVDRKEWRPQCIMYHHQEKWHDRLIRIAQAPVAISGKEKYFGHNKLNCFLNAWSYLKVRKQARKTSETTNK